METFIRIAELLATAFAASWITRLLTIKARVRQENAEASKTEAGVKADQIQNIQDIVEKVYKPTIDTLEKQVTELRWEIGELRKENAKILAENEELKSENVQYRRVIRELRPELVPPEKPSRRGENGKKQPRRGNGQFKRKEEAE